MGILGVNDCVLDVSKLTLDDIREMSDKLKETIDNDPKVYPPMLVVPKSVYEKLKKVNPNAV